MGEIVHRCDPIVGVVPVVELAQHHRGTVVKRDRLDRPGIVPGRDRRPRRNEVEEVDRVVVLAHVVVALGRAGVVVERDARADDVDERRALVLDRRPDERHELVFVAREAARDKRRAELQGEHHHVDRGIGVRDAALGFRAAVGGGGELALGEAVDAVVLDDVDHVDAAAHAVRELAEPDRRRVAVAGHAEIQQLAVGEVRPGHHRGHAAVHAVEAVRVAEEVIRRLRRAADARELGDAVGLDRELPAGLDDRRGDRVVAAPGAKGRDLALVVAAGVAETVLRQGRVVEFGLGEVGHLATLRSGCTFSRWTRSATASVMKRAVMGVPS